MQQTALADMPTDPCSVVPSRSHPWHLQDLCCCLTGPLTEVAEAIMSSWGPETTYATDETSRNPGSRSPSQCGTSPPSQCCSANSS